MGTSASENIAIQITTTADISGLVDARGNVTALGKATTDAATAIERSTDAAATATTALAAATDKAAGSGDTLAVSAEQMRTALEATGGNLQKAAQLLAQQAAAAESATIATEQLTAVTTAQAEAETVAAEVEARRIQGLEQTAVATQEAATATATASTAIVRSTQDADQGITRIPRSARTAANAIALLSQAAETGRGSMAGIANAAGGLAFGVSALVPEFALVSAGIGALVTVGATLYETLLRDADGADKFVSSISHLGDLTSSQFQIIEQARRNELDGIVHQIEANQRLIDSYDQLKAANQAQFGPAGQDITNQEVNRAEKDNAELLKRQQALSTELEKIVADRIATERREEQEAERERERDADIAAREAERRAQEAQRRRDEDLKKAESLDAALQEEQQAAIDKSTETEEQAAIDRAVRQEKRREEEIRALQISEDEKTKVILDAQAARDAQITAIHKAATDRQDADDQRNTDRAQREQESAQEQLEAVLSRGLEAAIQNSKSLTDALTKAFLTPIENYLEGIAEQETVTAVVDLAFGDFTGAAAHGAAAALAIAGARKVAQIGGLNSSGGASTPSAGSGGGYAGGSTFTPNTRDQNNGPIVVQLITQNPFSRENISEVSYQLQRAGFLNRPIYIPPTTGVTRAGG